MARNAFEDQTLLAGFILPPDAWLNPSARPKTPLTVQYIPGPTGRVYGDVSGDPEDIEQILANFRNDEPVKILAFVRALKDVKTAIFSLKGKGGRP